jgi:zinc transport system substrate-binding protein
MRAVLTIIAMVLVLCACGSAAGQRQGDIPLVVAGFYPLAEAARRVGGDDVDVVNLTPPGIEPHDLELAPDDVVSIAEADLVLYVGSGFQPALESALGETAASTVDVLDAVETISASDQTSESTDPHVWLDPARYEQVVGRVAEALASIAPSSSPSFDQNAAVFVSELEDLDASYRRDLAHCGGRSIVVNHAAFGYLAAAYDLVQEPITGISPEAEPDPRRFAELADVVRREGITTVFTEELAPPHVAEALADETGIDTAVLNPLEGLTDAELAAGDDYVSVMERNLEVLRRGLNCG